MALRNVLPDLRWGVGLLDALDLGIRRPSALRCKLL